MSTPAAVQEFAPAGAALESRPVAAAEAVTAGFIRSPTQYLDLPGGRIAYDDTGAPAGNQGPLVVALPSLGDVRGEYRLLTPLLVDAGCRVVTTDLRGQGESSTGWAKYSAEAVGGDVLALIEHLGAGRAIIVGTSLAGGAAVWAAAERPDLVAGTVLIGAFVRDMPVSLMQRLMLKVLLTRPWGPAAWGAYYQSLYPTARPADFAAYRRSLVRNLSQPGRFEATVAFMRASKASVEQRLGDVRVPTLVLYGTKDPDFKDPEAEALLIASRMGSAAPSVAFIPGAGHYPHAEMPLETAAEVCRFIEVVSSAGGASHEADRGR
jgi:pimeloyl-ACP methyl ester carboxylesterase